ncbi:hypothetical protein FAP39_10010 [Shimia litoralis]|uniref:Uncharacterized protein n=1 Tax=Shimia litoralis TaxID=420403 RepID=A0A4U7N4Y1_9RHOB|nr:hypothetical protein [Shimia litoralis]TKZ20613.1 hypothetical protein FAP39_10010 [Shimia litoralis]
MSNIVQLNVPSLRQSHQDRYGALMQSFAKHRRFGDDVFWLKENAELLNILECSGAKVGEDALMTYQGFYAQVEKRLQFFPQYYRFLLSICLDLEDLGMAGSKGAALVDWVAEQGFAHAELSDLQRMEARRLMARRGQDPFARDGGLEDRMRQFIARSATFAMPNKKAAYELTHAVFYLSEYGRKDPQLDTETRTSLEFTGLLAFLEQNADLLAEVCIALTYGGFAVPEIWKTWLVRHTHLFDVESGGQVTPQDDYHEFLVCNWMMSTCGQQGFFKPMAHDRMAFFRPEGTAGPLRELSECMYNLDEARTDDWEAMRPLVLDQLSEDAQVVVSWAETSSDKFGAFFQGFARTSLALVAM